MVFISSWCKEINYWLHLQRGSNAGCFVSNVTLFVSTLFSVLLFNFIIDVYLLTELPLWIKSRDTDDFLVMIKPIFFQFPELCCVKMHVKVMMPNILLFCSAILFNSFRLFWVIFHFVECSTPLCFVVCFILFYSFLPDSDPLYFFIHVVFCSFLSCWVFISQSLLFSVVICFVISYAILLYTVPLYFEMFILYCIRLCCADFWTVVCNFILQCYIQFNHN